MNPILRAGTWLVLALWLGGCSTVAGDFHQKLQIDALDAQNRPVEGMQCQVGSGDSAKHVVTPAIDVRVARSFWSLSIDCHKDALVATATVKSRREGVEQAMLPFGSAGVFVDHLSGALYAYPTTLHLRVGQHLVLEHGSEAKIAKSEPIPSPQPAVAAATQAPPATASKPMARAAPKPAKTTATVASSAKPRPPATQKVALSEAATPVAAARVPTAPVNW